MSLCDVLAMGVPGMREVIEKAATAEFEEYSLAIDRETDAHEALEYERMFVPVEKAEGDFERDMEVVRLGSGLEKLRARLRMVERVECFENVQEAEKRLEDASRVLVRARRAYLRVRDAAIRAHMAK